MLRDKGMSFYGLDFAPWRVLSRPDEDMPTYQRRGGSTSGAAEGVRLSDTFWNNAAPSVYLGSQRILSKEIFFLKQSKRVQY